MQIPKPRSIPFVLASTAHGALIVNRNDFCATPEGRLFGVGAQLFLQSYYDVEEVALHRQLLTLRRRMAGDGVVAIDCGANVGVHTVEWSRHLDGWGSVFALEAQERLFYALAGNIALNNCFNASAQNLAVGDTDTHIRIPQLNPNLPASFGSLELKRRAQGSEAIGQPVDYDDIQRTCLVQQIRLDTLLRERVDFIKIDVEGMEVEALEGAAQAIARERPYLFVEHIKSDREALQAFVSRMEYRVWLVGHNFLALHQSDPACARIVQEGNQEMVIRLD